MKIVELFKTKKYRKIIFASAVIIIIFALIRILKIEYDAVIQGLHSLLSPYLSLAEMLADSLVRILVDGVTIKNHVIIFQNYTAYYQENKEIIDHWPTYLLFLKWSAFLMLCIWMVHSSIKKKLLYTVFFILTHFFAVFSGLVMIAGIAPLLIDPNSLTELRPHTIGSLAMFSLFVIWFKNSKEELVNSLRKIGVKFDFSERKINEFLVLFLFFLLLKNFFVPYFNYYFYIDFLLRATQTVVGLFGYSSAIDGPYITGHNGGTLFMAKWCLGFITMFVFASMVYLTGTNRKTTWLYIVAGIILLHIFNIIRLSLLFVFVQYHKDSELIMDHHDMYNIVVYILIFIMWIIWFEKFSAIRKGKDRSV